MTHEIVEIILELSWLVMLVDLSIHDIKEQRIPATWPVLLGGLSFAISFGMGDIVWYRSIVGIVPGAIILFAAFISKEKIGYGDGLILCSIGMWMGALDSAWLWCVGSVLCAIYTASKMIVIRIKSKGEISKGRAFGMEIPFVPFISAAFLLLTTNKLFL